MSPEGETTATVLTAPGPGAIAVIAVRGPRALEVVNLLFLPTTGWPLRSGRPGGPRLGRIGSEAGEEVVAIPIAADPPEVEIHGHGGPAAVSALLDALAGLGVAIVGPPDFRAIEQGPWAAVAREALGHAPSLRVAGILLDQADGAFDRACERIRDLARVDGFAADREAAVLRGRGEVGRRMLAGWAVVLTGRPNVGKSRLLNALAGFPRAIVTASPGTTRDAVSADTAVGGWPVTLVDTAGLRPLAEAGPVESEGIARARERLDVADLVLAVFDRSEPLGDADHAILDAYPLALRVANKADLPPAWDAAEVGAAPVSAATGEGVPALLDAIAARIVPDPPPPGAAFPFTPPMMRAIARASSVEY